MNKYWTIGLSSVLALGACAQPATDTRATAADPAETEASVSRTVRITVTGMN